MKYIIRVLAPFLALISLTGCNPQSEAPGAQMLATGVGPHLAVDSDGSAVVSYVVKTATGNALRFQSRQYGKWSEAQTVAEDRNWFVNWADFPSVEPISDSLWAAHWLVRREAGGYAYDVYASVSDDAGQTWGEPFMLHDDGTDTEHGFVSLFPVQGDIGAIWLDGRNMASDADSATSHGTGGMTLRSGRFDTTATVSQEQVIDDLTCDCCQTDVAVTSEGPVAVYRNRSNNEVRDIYISRFVDYAWQEGIAVNNDGWVISGCPVNGPVVSAAGANVAVTWFTSAGDVPTVKTAWSADSGRTFTPPVTLADKGVVGYVGATLIDETSAVASWLCKGSQSRNMICFRSIEENGALGPVQHLETQSVVSRMSVPQLAKVGDQLLFVWTEKIDGQFQINSATVPL